MVPFELSQAKKNTLDNFEPWLLGTMTRSIQEILKKAEQPLSLLPTSTQRREEKKQRVSNDTAGPAWFDMPAPKMTNELENDIRLLNMRSALDPKQHYKNGKAITSKYFQVFLLHV